MVEPDAGFAERLTALVRHKTGDAGARATSLTTLPGHAGFSYSFALERSDGGVPSGRMVVRVAPPGVKISGPADVVRQAKIMASLANTDVPVPPIHWYGDEAEYFGRPYLIDGFVDGFKLQDADLSSERLKALALQGVELLVRLHAVDWRPRSQAFGDPATLAEEIARLDHLLDRPTLDPALTARAPAVRERLRATMPQTPRLGCVHGDFQWANILFAADGPSALIDWELSSIGPTLLDVGWLCFFADAANFGGHGRPVREFLSADEIAEAYAAATPDGVNRRDLNWFRAFSGYRFGVITCFNVMLHRRGKREDPEWELRAPSAPLMFERALELLST